ncbi:MAG: Gx transporter family protein [Treponema sp.]|jgi:heptaprenyl diphosphate synthase|nr:Gx transporter family protein [Treponema sp.]
MSTVQHGNSPPAVALFGAFCLFLSTVEYLIPKPIPFMRLGLANVPLMLATTIFPFKTFLILVLMKIFGQALVSGTLFSYIFLFSMAGTTVSALAMYSIHRVVPSRYISFIGIGIIGACFSNGVQLILARFIIFGESARYITPPFLIMGSITGLSLGIFCEHFKNKSQWYQAQLTKKSFSGEYCSITPSPKILTKSICSSRDICIAGLIALPAFLFNQHDISRVIQCILFMLYVLLTGKKINIVMTVIVIGTIIGFNLLVPFGKVLIAFGTLKITEGALWAGIRRAVTLEGLIMLSKASIRHDLQFPGTFGMLISESFRLFALIPEQKNTLNPKYIIRDLDSLLLTLSASPVDTVKQQQRSTPLGIMFLAVAVSLVWLMFFVPFFA